jgi:riboflavin kinase / FMN adenylyltransferase
MCASPTTVCASTWVRTKAMGNPNLYRRLEDIPENFGPCAITIGNFDGVHRGHQEILRRVREKAREEGWKSAVLTFDPHPGKVLAPASAPRLLTTVEQRARLITQQGIEEILILPFNSAVSELSPEDFVREILADKLKVRAVLVGANFHFGKRAAGDAAMLEELGDPFSFETEIIQPVVCRGRVVSSSEIRRLIEAGDVSTACRMLGRPYTLEGAVVPGEGRGSKQTVPTLNLATKAEVIPKDGVYVTRTETLGRPKLPSVTNIGLRPTFDGRQRTIETFVLSNLTADKRDEMSIKFLHRLRDERKFENSEALKAQILRDVNRAQTYFRRLGACENREMEEV